MKFPFLIALLFLVATPLLAQKKSSIYNSPYKTEKDTLYARVDQNGAIINLNGAQYIRKWWPEKGLWHENLYNAESGVMVRDALYKDDALSEMNGIWMTFHPNGMMQDSGNFVDNKREGVFLGWHENGQERINARYKKGHPADSCFRFFEDGQLAELSITDDWGNGIAQEYYPTGKIRLVGKLREGKREDLWILKREDGTRLMQLAYLQDSITGTQCFNETGTEAMAGTCIYEKPAAFPGGLRAWSLYMSKNLRYPSKAVDNNIEAIVLVQFIIDKEGKVSEVQALGNADKLLADEAVKLIRKSPKWEPAVQLNKTVIYRHIQAITFRLK